MSICRLLTALLFALLVTSTGAEEQHLTDVLNLEATVSSEITPDLFVVVIAANLEGEDTAKLTQEVNQILTQAFTKAKTQTNIQASSGGYSTIPRYDEKRQPKGWQVRGELILKSNDFSAVGKLAGQLAKTMQIANSRFEVSPELQRREETRLIEQGLTLFRTKAKLAAQALGYSTIKIREVSLGSASLGGNPQPMMMMKSTMSAQEATPMPVENGQVTLQLRVTGSVKMKR